MSLSKEAITHRKEQAKEYYQRVKELRKKQAHEWYLRNRDRRLESSRKWQKENRDRINAHRRAHPEIYATKNWNKENPEKAKESQRASGIKKRFGITAAEYDQRIADQNGRCEICLGIPNGKKSKSKLHLDHDHKTKKLRGFICGQCNTGLGMARDSINILKSMLAYLEKYA